MHNNFDLKFHKQPKLLLKYLKTSIPREYIVILKKIKS